MAEGSSDAGSVDAEPTERAWRRASEPFHRQFADHMRTWGLWRSVYWTLMRMLARTVGLYLHYVCVSANRPDLADPKPPVVPPDYSFRLVDFKDLLPYTGRVPGLTREFLDKAFQVGNEIVAAGFHGDELVALDFNTRSRMPVTDQLDVLIPKGFSYGYKSWTHPEHARRNLQKMLGHIERTQGHWPFEERGIWYVETHNYPSLLHGYRHPSERMMIMGFTGWISWFGMEIPFNSRRAKKIGLEFVYKGHACARQYLN